jgi:hypothetical protein
VTSDNQGRAVALNFIVVNGPDGWVILDAESPHDSLMFLAVQALVLVGACAGIGGALGLVKSGGRAFIEASADTVAERSAR